MYYVSLISVLLAVLTLLSIHAKTTVAVQIVPQPVSVQSGSNQLQLNPAQFQIFSNSDSKILDRAIQRTRQSFFPFKASEGRQFEVKIAVKSSSEDLHFGVDESYSINLQFGKGNF